MGSIVAGHMGAWVLATAALALVFPEPLQGIRPTVINPMLGIVMLGMGMTLRLQDLRILASRPRLILAGMLAQYTAMPLLAWLLCRAFNLDEALAIGVILVGCCPGGTASNVVTYLARGDVALSIGTTAASTLLAPLATPLLVWMLAGKAVNVNVPAMLLSILCVVILPIATGLILKRLFPKATEKATACLPTLSTLAIAAIVAIVVAANAQKLATCGAQIAMAVILHNTGGYLLGYLAARTIRCNRAQSKALSIEVGMQNSGLATSLATLHFAAYPLATVPGAVFSVWHNISGALLARFYSFTDNENNGRRKQERQTGRGRTEQLSLANKCELTER